MKCLKCLFLVVLFTTILVSCGDNSKPDDNVDANYRPISVILYDEDDREVGTIDLEYVEEKLTAITRKIPGKSDLREYLYDSQGQLSNIKINYKTYYAFTYDEAGNMVQALDFISGSGNTYEYNESGLCQVNEYASVFGISTGKPAYKNFFEYDENNHLTYIKSGNIEDNYKITGQIQQRYENDDVCRYYAYWFDEIANRVTQKGYFDMLYDANHRLLSISRLMNLVGDDIAFTYDENHLTEIQMVEDLFGFKYPVKCVFTWEEGKSNLFEISNIEMSQKNFLLSYISDYFNLLQMLVW